MESVRDEYIDDLHIKIVDWLSHHQYELIVHACVTSCVTEWCSIIAMCIMHDAYFCFRDWGDDQCM